MLTDATIRKVKPGPKPIKLFDSGGLYLLIHPNGGRWWRLKYRFHGREKLISLGVYRTDGRRSVSLAHARLLRDEARMMLAEGTDPSENRKQKHVAAGETFLVVASEWIESRSAKLAPVTTRKNRERLEAHVFPHLGSMAMREIKAPVLLRVLRRIEGKNHSETAHRLLRLCGQIFRYAISTGRADHNPSGDLKGALAPTVVTHRAAVTDPRKVGALLRMYESYDGTPPVKAALRLAPLVFVRPGELRHMEWTDVDLEAATWSIPGFKRKTRGGSLTVPLADQAVAILREIQRVTGDGRYVFPSPTSGDRPMSDNAILAAMRRMGIAKEEMTGHGWRAVARTMLDEVLGVRVDLIEAQLGHMVRDPLGRAYNRTTFLPERKAMMQQWADYLDSLKNNSTTKKESAS